jgi:DNA-binding NarL/FixJ family response regulator
LKRALEKHPRVQLVGESGDGEEALSLARRLKPDVVLVDIQVPGLDGFQLTQRLRQELPAAKVLIVSMHRESERVVEALRLGANGFLSKAQAITELAVALEAVMSGAVYLAPGAAAQGREQPPAALSRREQEVLVLVAEGLASKEIAQRLGIRVRTLEAHREKLRGKLQLRSVAELTRYALAHGLLEPKPRS